MSLSLALRAQESPPYSGFWPVSDTATDGCVKFADVDLSSLDEDGRAAVRANQVGFVFQSFQLLPSLTALEKRPCCQWKLAGPCRSLWPGHSLACKRGGVEPPAESLPGAALRWASNNEWRLLAPLQAIPASYFADEPHR